MLVITSFCFEGWIWVPIASVPDLFAYFYSNYQQDQKMVFRKGAILPRDLEFYFNDIEIEIMNTFSYLGIVFFFQVYHFQILKSPLQPKFKRQYSGLIVIFIKLQIFSQETH